MRRLVAFREEVTGRSYKTASRSARDGRPCVESFLVPTAVSTDRALRVSRGFVVNLSERSGARR